MPDAPLPQDPGDRHDLRHLPARPEAGQGCTSHLCERPALPGRWVCAEHAEAIAARGARLTELNFPTRNTTSRGTR